jgi:predicted nucleic acid-binding protein
MKVLIDVNVMLDFLQRREPFFENAASVMDAILYGTVEGLLAAHGVTTLYYFLARGAEKRMAGETMRWLLDTFEVASCDKQILTQALSFDMPDFEDAVTAMSAERAGCSHIITRNAGDFVGSCLPALPPAEFLRMLETE